MIECEVPNCKQKDNGIHLSIPSPFDEMKSSLIKFQILKKSFRAAEQKFSFSQFLRSAN